MNTRDYFEEIGAWPRHSRRIARAYVGGFILSLALTLGAYLLAVGHALPQQAALVVLATLACVQFGVQLICFLHLGRETASRERVVILCGAVFIVLVLVSGSLWIMFSLSQRMMPDAAQMAAYMQDQQGI